MGNTKNTAGKRVFNDVYSFPQDSQDLADDLFAAWNIRVGTAQERQDEPTAKLRNGLTWVETDTRITRQWFTATGWIRFPFEQAWEALAPQTGWSANSGSGAPRITRDGDTVFYQGGLFGGAANSTAAVLPAWARPSRDVRVLGLATNGETPVMIRVLANGVFSPAGTVIHTTTSASWTVR